MRKWVICLPRPRLSSTLICRQLWWIKFKAFTASRPWIAHEMFTSLAPWLIISIFTPPCASDVNMRPAIPTIFFSFPTSERIAIPRRKVTCFKIIPDARCLQPGGARKRGYRTYRTIRFQVLDQSVYHPLLMRFLDGHTDMDLARGNQIDGNAVAIKGPENPCEESMRNALPV